MALVDGGREAIARRTGIELEICRIAVRDPGRGRPGILDRGGLERRLTTSPETIVTAADVDLVVELMGGTEPAGSLVLSALAAKKPVVSANKELLATSGRELSAAAEAAGVDLLFEASVAGAIPLVRLLRDSLAGEQIARLTGIVNGTTNYMLTQMSDEGLDYAEALSDAQELGYAEADPTADVEGFDAAAKAAILAGVAFDADVVVTDVHREGISGLETSDIEFAHRLGYEVKLLAIAERVGPSGDGRPAVAVRVHPAMVPKDHPLSSVRGPFNAVFVEGDAVGELMVYGRGAGGKPTASAVLGDVIDAAHHLREGSRGRSSLRHPADLRPITELRSQYYLTIDVADRPGVLAAVASGLRSEPRLDPLDGADRPRRRGPPRVHHPYGARSRPAGHSPRARRPRGRRADREHAPGDRGRGGCAVASRHQPVSDAALARPWRGVIEEYRELLPVDDSTPVVTLLEGATPLLAAPRLSDRVNAEVFLKIEGANPTGSFKDRGMTVAISKAAAAGAGAVVCASTGNTSASAAAYAARAGMSCWVLIPEGHIALGKLAQALVHGARVLQVRGNFDVALAMVRELPSRVPVVVVNSVNPDRIAGQMTGAFEIVDVLGDAPDVPPDTGGQRRQHRRLLAGLLRLQGCRPFDAPAADARLPGRGRRTDRARPARRGAGDDRDGDPHRQPGIVVRRHGGRERVGRADRGRHRRRDPRGVLISCL